MLIASYEQWEAEQRQIMEQENPLLECRRCDGEGEIVEDCPCCGHEKEEECPTCEGAGQIRYEDAPIGLQREQVEPWMYFDQVIADLKKWCAYTREDFLKLAGGFVNEFRKQAWEGLMDGNTARTILSLNDQRDKAEASKREALLELAEMKHELQILRHMKREILVCLLDRRLPHYQRDGSSPSCHHTVSRIARIVRSAHAGN